jgi:hypothetical protein
VTNGRAIRPRPPSPPSTSTGAAWSSLPLFQASALPTACAPVRVLIAGARRLRQRAPRPARPALRRGSGWRGRSRSRRTRSGPLAPRRGELPCRSVAVDRRSASRRHHHCDPGRLACRDLRARAWPEPLCAPREARRAFGSRRRAAASVSAELRRFRLAWPRAAIFAGPYAADRDCPLGPDRRGHPCELAPLPGR